MKVTQNPKTGKLIVDGEGEKIFVTKCVPWNDPVEKLTNFVIYFEEKGKKH